MRIRDGNSAQFEPDWPDWPDGIAAIARAAGKVIMDIYATDFTVRGKSDASPVTLADEEAEAAILGCLRELSPKIPSVAEEENSPGRIPFLRNRFRLVDLTCPPRLPYQPEVEKFVKPWRMTGMKMSRFSAATYYKWRAKFGGMDASDAKRLKELQSENTKLKKLLSEAHLDTHASKSVLGVKR